MRNLLAQECSIKGICNMVIFRALVPTNSKCILNGKCIGEIKEIKELINQGVGLPDGLKKRDPTVEECKEIRDAIILEIERASLLKEGKIAA